MGWWKKEKKEKKEKKNEILAKNANDTQKQHISQDGKIILEHKFLKQQHTFQNIKLSMELIYLVPQLKNEDAG
jgi:hypothetical protein